MFLLSSQLFRHKFYGYGRLKGGKDRHRILKFDIFPSSFLMKRFVFVVSSGENLTLPLLSPLQTYFWPTPGESTIGPSWKKSFQRSCLGVHVHLSKC